MREIVITTFLVACLLAAPQTHRWDEGTGDPPGTTAGMVRAQQQNQPWVTDWQKFLESVRKRAVEYTNDLPNFVCTQTVHRQAIVSRDQRIVLDGIVAEVSFFEKKERYRILRIGDKPPPEDSTQARLGVTSIGEFGGSLALLFDPRVDAQFRFTGVQTVAGRKAVRISYRVRKDSSRNVISIGKESATVAYHGQCWVEPESLQVIRLQDNAEDIPGNFPITFSESSTDYDLVDIAGGKYWLPVRASLRMTAENDGRRGVLDFYRSLVGPTAPPNMYPAKVEAINMIAYSNYHKFESKVKITY